MTEDNKKKPSSKARDAAPKAEAAGQAAGERIAKRLSRAGVASRRDAEAMIAAGRVSLNGKVLDTPAVIVTERDRIEVDGAPLPASERTRLFLFHKPAGVVTTNRDPEGRRTVFDVLPKSLPRLITIGRLDLNTEGLLLLTNDGGLARVLELPTTGWLRRYRVRVHGKVEPEALEKLKEGIAVDGVFYGSIEASLDRVQGTNAWLMIGLREGKNREVRNVLGALGLDVNRLIRVSYGPFQLGELAEGAVQEIKGRTLRDQLGERLIREAGADFEAPVAKPFANKAQKAEPEAETPAKPRAAKERPSREKNFDREKAPATRRADRPDRQQRRDEALDRLQTSRPARSGDKSKPGEKREQMPRRRNANVWMAPGARPLGKKRFLERAEREEAEAAAPERRRKPAGEAGRSKPRADRAPDASDRPARMDDRARPSQAGKPSRPPRGDRPEKGEPRPGRRERAEASTRGERPPRSDRPSRPEREGKPPRQDRAPRAGGAGRGDRDRPNRPSRPGKPQGRPGGGKPGSRGPKK